MKSKINLLSGAAYGEKLPIRKNKIDAVTTYHYHINLKLKNSLIQKVLRSVPYNVEISEKEKNSKASISSKHLYF